MMWMMWILWIFIIYNINRMSGVFDISGATIERVKTIVYKSYKIVIDRFEIGEGRINAEIVLLDNNGNYIKSIGCTLDGEEYTSIFNENLLISLINNRICNMNETNTL
jgi:hypothetical protein